MRTLGVLLLTFLLPAAENLRACSVCRCGDHSFFLNNARLLPAGRLLLGVDHLNTRKSAGVIHHDEHGQALAKAVLPSTIHHEDPTLETQTQNAVQFNLKYGLATRVMLLASVPYIFNRIATDTGAETASGLGDPEMLAIAHLLNLGAWRLQGLAGARLPLGISDLEESPGVRREQHLQPGSGAWAGIFGVQLLQPSGRVPLFLSASYQANGSNAHDFAYGNVFRFNVAAQTALAGAFDLIAEVNGRMAEYDKDGAESDPNSGGTAVYFSPGLRLRLGAASLRSQVQIPVIENLHGGQNEKINLRTGLMWEL
ncbi:MAG: hypothetical protein ONB48_18665 [candidate division KSB1 bacterium]|nr:hypothetical protein [candidate division KSB1 bacterium]MDZ7276379.1 hypothetical protein [candidate division KSB1 bacterium]MDZ7287669.1 hypothetical protein [candidate division KSB1 bacterium]MDZ7299991.1 hypothetical protein [candidate division KSB1 bacterium]MDZ7307340.1 hypothetical protein [candidate division KSB1 bacterium]